MSKRDWSEVDWRITKEPCVHSVGWVRMDSGRNGNLGLIFADSSLRKNTLPTVRTYSRSLGAIGLVTTALFLGQIYFVFGMGGMEKLAAFPLQIWTACIGVY